MRQSCRRLFGLLNRLHICIVYTFILGFAFPAWSNRGARDISWKASGDIKFNVPTWVLSSMLVLSPCEKQEKLALKQIHRTFKTSGMKYRSNKSAQKSTRIWSFSFSQVCSLQKSSVCVCRRKVDWIKLQLLSHRSADPPPTPPPRNIFEPIWASAKQRWIWCHLFYLLVKH